MMMLFGSHPCQGEILYSGLIGGIDRGDGASLPALGFKVAFDPAAGVEVTYGRGGIRSEGAYQEKEQLFSVGYRLSSSNGSWSPFIGLGGAVLKASSSAEHETQDSIVGAVAVSTGLQVSFFKIGIDSFMAIIPGTDPFYAVGIRNFWYLGLQVAF